MNFREDECSSCDLRSGGNKLECWPECSYHAELLNSVPQSLDANVWAVSSDGCSLCSGSQIFAQPSFKSSINNLRIWYSLTFLPIAFILFLLLFCFYISALLLLCFISSFCFRFLLSASFFPHTLHAHPLSIAWKLFLCDYIRNTVGSGRCLQMLWINLLPP